MYIASTVHVGHAHKIRGSRWADDKTVHASMADKVAQNMESYANVIEDHYFVGPWVLGEQYSMCDPYLALVTRWLRPDGVLLDNFPKTKIARCPYAHSIINAVNLANLCMIFIQIILRIL